LVQDGVVTTTSTSGLCIEDILADADAEMYTDKQKHYAAIGGVLRG
jgi:hypothetical protein